MSKCPVCARVGGSLPTCSLCGLPKKPWGRDASAATANGYCDFECPGYVKAPEPGVLWPGERWGDSIGHHEWHEVTNAQGEPGDE